MTTSKTPANRAFKPTAAMREKVATAVAGGMTQEAIAEALGISRPTLCKHFGPELRSGAAQRRMQALVLLYREARRGKVSAIRAYLNLAPTVFVSADLPAEPRALVDRSSGRARPYGKKMLAEAAAPGAELGSEWDGLLPKHGDPTH